MKTWVKVLLAITLLAVFIIIGYKAWNSYDKKSVYKGRYDALAEEYDTQRDNSKAQISSLRNIISQKDEEIRNKTSHIVEKAGEISTLHAETDELEYAYATLSSNVATVDTLQKRVDNLETQVTIWKQKFSIAETIIADKDTIIFSLNAKYEAQVKISLEWETMYGNEVKLHSLCKQRLSMADKRVGGLRFGGTIKSGLIIGLAGVVIYGLLR